ncbi:MAG: hypothetical protein AB1659_10975 [Thermodesulfobacteriota bacterium]
MNLRGYWSNQEYIALTETAQQLGLMHVDLELDAKRAPTRSQLIGLIQHIETLPRPFLIYCRAGIDRSGLASVLALMAVAGKRYEEAKEALFDQWQYLGGMRDNSTGALFAAYEEFCSLKGRGTGGWTGFKEWAIDHFRPYYYYVMIKAPEKLTLSIGKEEEISLMVTNGSYRPIPFADPDKRFTVAAFLGSSVEDKPDRELGPRVSISHRNLMPGESVQVIFRISPFQTRGRYHVGFDLIEEDRTWFARQGSPISRCDLTIN